MSIVVLWCIVLPFFLCVPLLLGIYTYRDAKSRGMNAILWALAAALAPTFLGFLIYLLVRGSYSNLVCPQCGTAVLESYVVCPQCGAKLRASCANCGSPVEPGWQVCPQCAQPLAREAMDFTPSVKPKDKGLGKILLIVILIPVLFLTVLFLSFAAVGQSGASHTACYSEPEFVMLANQKGLGGLVLDIQDQAKEDGSKIYVLTSTLETADGLTQWNYLIYLPHAAAESISTEQRNGLLGSHFRVQYEDGENQRGEFVMMTIYAEKEPDLVIECRGVVKPCVEVPVDVDLSQFTNIEDSWVIPAEGATEVMIQ